MPTEAQLMGAQNAINRQHPSLPKTGDVADVRLSGENLAAICSALGIAANVVREGKQPSPGQVGWAAIIVAGLVARGAPRLESAVIAALERCKLTELERMAELVLEAGLSPLPDTPETVAEKAKAARGALDAFRDGGHPAATFSPEVEPARGGKR